jgi:MFS family permease
VAGRPSVRPRRPSRLVLLVLLIGAAAAGVASWLISASGTMLLLFGLLFGALALPGYSLAAAHAYDKTPANDVVPIAATILLTNGLGSVVGPLIAAAFMSAEGPRALFLFTAMVQALLAAYVFYRTRVQVSLASPQKTEFDLCHDRTRGHGGHARGAGPSRPFDRYPGGLCARSHAS